MLDVLYNSTPYSPNSEQRWFKLCLSYVDYVAPNETQMETGRIVKLLCEHPHGLTRDEILSKFYTNYEFSSVNRKESLRICLEKIIQRSRQQYSKYHLTIFYCKKLKKYYLGRALNLNALK